MISEAIAESTIPYPRLRIHSTNNNYRVPQFECFIGVSEHINELKDFTNEQATGNEPVLLVGERGLRQEQIARALHQSSENRLEPFLAIDVRGLDIDALNRLLFGRRGVVQALKRGTLYINDLMRLPAILLQRFAIHIEEQRWRPQSSFSSKQRLIFATETAEIERTAENRLAYVLVEQFRSSSFFLKPLRERSEDIPYLVEHLTKRIAKRLGKGEHGVTPDVMLKLTEYSWERNIDEIESVLESMISSAPPPSIDETSLPARVRHARLQTIPPEGIDLPRLVDDFEQSLIETTLRQTKGNQTLAAQLLHLRVQTLNMKIKRFSNRGNPIGAGL